MNIIKVARLAVITLGLGLVIVLLIANPINTLLLLGALVLLSATRSFLGVPAQSPNQK